MKSLCYLELESTDAPWNLAAEQHVFDALPRDRSCFLLWQNRSAVIIGKHQDTLAEIDRRFVEEHGIQVVRRLSGGGAVYHDLGNLNYTVITDAVGTKRLDMSLFCRPVLQVLRDLGVPAELCGRNDLTLAGRKFSGSAQYLRRGRILHHGTLLFDSDLRVVQQALRVDPEKIRSKGLPSVRSRVTNLRPYLPEEISLPRFRQALLEEVLRHTPGEPLVFSEADRASIEELCRSRYRSWDWNVGVSPASSLIRRRRFEDCGTVEARVRMEHGRIAALRFVGDYFSAEEPEALAEALLGLPLERQAVAAVLEKLDVPRFFLGLDAERLLALLCEEDAPAEGDRPAYLGERENREAKEML